MHAILVRYLAWSLFISGGLVLLLAIGYRSLWSPPMEPALIGYWSVQDDTAPPYTPNSIQIAADATALVRLNDDLLHSLSGTIKGRELIVTRGNKRIRYQLDVAGDTMTLRDAQTTYVFDRVFANLSHPGLSR